MDIREATPLDQSAIEALHTEAFGKEEGPEVATLVSDLLKDTSALPLLSLVAIEDNTIVGNIIFSKVSLPQASESISAQLLAPLAVSPEMQGKGVGTQLINKGLEQLKKSGVDLVFVLGHPEYYPRCGFKTAGVLGFEAPYPISEKDAAAWMVIGLTSDIIGNTYSKVQCATSLDKPEYWC